MARAEVSAVVSRPIEEVFSFAADLENDPKWHPRCLESKRTTEGPLGVGTKYREVYNFMGRLEILMEITEFEPNKKVAFKGTPTGGPMAPQDVITFQQVEGGTRVTYLTTPVVRGLFKLLDPLMSLMASRELQRIMAKLEPALASRS